MHGKRISQLETSFKCAIKVDQTSVKDADGGDSQTSVIITGVEANACKEHIMDLIKSRLSNTVNDVKFPRHVDSTHTQHSDTTMLKVDPTTAQAHHHQQFSGPPGLALPTFGGANRQTDNIYAQQGYNDSETNGDVQHTVRASAQKAFHIDLIQSSQMTPTDWKQEFSDLWGAPDLQDHSIW